MMAANEAREKFIDVPGGRIFAKIWASDDIPQKIPIILLHDSLGSVEMWRDFPEKLAQQTQRPIVAYDRLGFGLSSARDELPSARFVKEEAEIYFPCLLNALGIDDFLLFGHSVGGSMAVACAIKFEQRCQAIITEAAQAFVEERTLQGIRIAKKNFEDPKVFERLEKYHGDKARWVLDAWTETWLSEEFKAWSLKDDLPQVKCPILAIHGDHDEYGSLRFPEVICELGGGLTEKYIVPSCGHVPHREKMDFILPVVDDFLSRVC